ncbi:TPA: hypothetical protein ACG0PC_004852, partial [Salmonella enterica subsp. enterica serovar Derby]
QKAASSLTLQQCPVEAREAMLEANPFLRDWYSADDGKFTVFYLKNMQAVLYSFTGDPEILDN